MRDLLRRIIAALGDYIDRQYERSPWTHSDSWKRRDDAR